MPGFRRRTTRAQRAMSVRFGTRVAFGGVFATDTTALSITGDIDLRALLSCDNWVPAGLSVIVAKDASSNRSYDFYLDTAGKLNLFLSSAGSTGVNHACSVATGFAANTLWWVRATWRNSDDRVQYFSAPGHLLDPQSGDWTQMGADGSIAVSAIYDGTASLEIGSAFGITASLLNTSNVYRAQVLNGIDGTLVANWDPRRVLRRGTRQPSTFVDSTGLLWYLIGPAADWAA